MTKAWRIDRGNWFRFSIVPEFRFAEEQQQMLRRNSLWKQYSQNFWYWAASLFIALHGLCFPTVGDLWTSIHCRISPQEPQRQHNMPVKLEGCYYRDQHHPDQQMCPAPKNKHHQNPKRQYQRNEALLSYNCSRWYNNRWLVAAEQLQYSREPPKNECRAQ
jgi:hypothetical protein